MTVQDAAAPEPRSAPDSHSSRALPSPTSRTHLELLGDVAWVMMDSDWHSRRRIADIGRLVMPGIARRQFRLYYDGDVPIGFVSWARLSGEAEQRFMADPDSLQADDWTGGETVYIVDLVASKGNLRKVLNVLRRDPLVTQGTVKAIRIRDGLRALLTITAMGGAPQVMVTELD
jgi:cytolysin-activating lysine-acyltransferase